MVVERSAKLPRAHHIVSTDRGGIAAYGRQLSDRKRNCLLAAARRLQGVQQVEWEPCNLRVEFHPQWSPARMLRDLCELTDPRFVAVTKMTARELTPEGERWEVTTTLQAPVSPDAMVRCAERLGITSLRLTEFGLTQFGVVRRAPAAFAALQHVTREFGLFIPVVSG